jgi:hypothetical protein
MSESEPLRQRHFERVRRDLVRMAHANYDLSRVFHETARLLREAVPFDAACLHTLDPASLLETSRAVLDLPLPHPRATEIEYEEAAFLRSVSEIVAHAIWTTLVRAAAVHLDEDPDADSGAGLPDAPGVCNRREYLR